MKHPTQNILNILGIMIWMLHVTIKEN